MDEIGEATLRIMKAAGWYNNWLFSLIEPHLAGEILEVGAGIGTFTKMFSGKGKVTAIEIEDKYLEILKRLKSDNIRVGFGDIEKGKYFFKEDRFDTIVCLNVLEHIENDFQALENMYKLLVAGGRLILLVPAHMTLYGSLDKNLDHFRRYNKNLLIKKVGSAGFSLLRVSYLNLAGAFGWFFNAKILKRKIISKSQLLFFDKLVRPLLLLEKIVEAPFGLSLLVIAKK